MSSIIEGFNYDIFISYRQKDNKGDRWVSEFVGALKTELESTFKEEISIYFDINPHDGLLETHDVDASLKEKLRCLIFIPIISRTYCDPKSFAWDHEFKAFIEMTAKDQFGLKIKLPNGNVTSRVLPVRIHDLDKGDLNECELMLNGTLRGIEFIYKESGVNRPLKITDIRNENLNKTDYRNQINKVALAIKDIISGIRGNGTVSSDEPEKPLSVTKKSVPQEKSIIVLPFENISPEEGQEYFSDGLTEEIITDLSKIHDLLVISRSSAMTFKGTKKKAVDIAAEINVRYVLEGSVRKADNRLRITAQLIDGISDMHIWAEKYNGTMDDIFDIQEKVSRSIFDALRLKLTSKEEKRLSEKPISDVVTYEFYLRAKNEMWSFSEKNLDHALLLTNQALSNAGDNYLLYATRALINWQYHNAGFKPNAEILEVADRDAQKSLDLNPECAAAHYAKGSISYTKGDLGTAAREYRKASELESGGECLAWLSYIYALTGDVSEARKLSQLAFKIDPLNIIVCILNGLNELWSGNFREAVNSLMKGYEVEPESPVVKWILAVAQMYAGLKNEALSTFSDLAASNAEMLSSGASMWMAAARNDAGSFKECVAALKDYASRDKEISWMIADCSAIMGYNDEALNWVENAIDQGSCNYTFFLEYDPFTSKLKNDPRVTSLVLKAKNKREKFSSEMR